MSALTIRLPASLKSKLVQAAKRLGKSPEEFVRETLRASLQEPAPSPAPSLYNLSRDLCGNVNGGPSDLARNKAHLEGYGTWGR